MESKLLLNCARIYVWSSNDGDIGVVSLPGGIVLEVHAGVQLSWWWSLTLHGLIFFCDCLRFDLSIVALVAWNVALRRMLCRHGCAIWCFLADALPPRMLSLGGCFGTVCLGGYFAARLLLGCPADALPPFLRACSLQASSAMVYPFCRFSSWVTLLG